MLILISLTFLCFSSQFTTVAAQGNTTNTTINTNVTSNVNYTGNPCAYSSTIGMVRAYFESPLFCLVVGQRNNETELLKTQFTVDVDLFSVFAIANISDNANATNITDIRVQMGQLITPYRRYNHSVNGIAYVVPFYTLIVEADNGRVTSLSWDEDCGICDTDQQCFDGDCAVPADQCGTLYDCTLKIYIGWIGSDRTGSYMTSAGMRISRFRQFSIRSAYNNAAALGDNAQTLPYFDYQT